ncbi:hypothetical protein FRC10_006925 [Ceratobasidium sp. 414]|nr:hypothetical protein FRC10_006925 [Ceratobasidium sp. 414]
MSLAQPAILARNILLLTLLEDDAHIDRLWDLFYHFKVDERTSETITRQSQRLYELARDAEEWRQSPYASFLQFVDTRTLADLRGYWKDYADFANLPASRIEKLRREQSQLSESLLKTFKENLGPSRSAGMVWPKAISPLSNIYKEYWKTGTTSALASDINAAKNLNPALVYSLSGERFDLHPDTFPQAFHLAPAFAPIASDPMNAHAPNNRLAPMDLAKRQFEAWGDAFRSSRAAGALTIHFYSGDGVLFCRALDLYSSTRHLESRLPVRAWCAAEICLGGSGVGESPAPTFYDVIDTSDLADQVGLFNLFTATRPLMKGSQSVLYTEQILPADETGVQPLSKRLLTTVPTISALLGLTPLAWLSGFTTHSNVHETMFNVSSSVERVAWVDPTGGDSHTNLGRAPVSFNADELAKVLFHVYDEMLIGERDFGDRPRTLSWDWYHSIAKVHYHPESMSVLIQLLKRRIRLRTGTWDFVLKTFLEIVHDNRGRYIRTKNFEDLCLHLHLYDIYSVDSLKPDWRARLGLGPASGLFKDWPSVPPKLCVVLTVPSRCFEALSLGQKKTLAPVLQCDLSVARRYYNGFSAIHAVWGRCAKTQGSNVFVLMEDPLGFNGTSGLVVAFWAPSHLLEVPNTSVALTLKRTHHANLVYMPTLGPLMELFSASVSDEQFVQLLTYRPALPSASQPLLQYTIPSFPAVPSPGGSISFVAGVSQNSHNPSVVSLTAHVNINPPAQQKALLNGTEVTAAQIGPCTIKLSIADYHHILSYPYPIFGAIPKLRIARKSHYVEVIVPVSQSQDSGGYSMDHAPALRRNGCSPWNVHRIPTDRIPLLDTADPNKLIWLSFLTGLQMSDQERAIMSGSAGTIPATISNGLASVKDTIHMMVMQTAAILSKRKRAYALCETSESTLYALILVGGIRLDLSSLTVVLDVALLPLSEIRVSAMVPGLSEFDKAPAPGRFLAIGQEAIAWRRLFPAYVERCRTWTHTSNCEYAVHDTIPISIELEQNPICTCGEGIGFDAAEWRIPAWKGLLPFATRAAISPLFSIPHVDSLSQTVRDLRSGLTGPPPAGVANRLQILNACWLCGSFGDPELLACRLEDPQTEL